jgi:membrane-bound serine protease (ClpP class)
MPRLVICLLLAQLKDVNTAVMVVTAAVIIFLLFGAWKALQSHRVKPTTGREGLIGQTGEAITDLEPVGQVEVRGEIWRAEAVGENLKKGSRVIVIDEKDLTLYVRLG